VSGYHISQPILNPLSYPPIHHGKKVELGWGSHSSLLNIIQYLFERGAFDSAKNHKRQRRKRQSVTASP